MTRDRHHNPGSQCKLRADRGGTEGRGWQTLNQRFFSRRFGGECRIEGMADHIPRRRWFQFSLASLLWLMLVIAVSVLGFRERQQRLILDAEVASLKAEVEWGSNAQQQRQGPLITGLPPGAWKIIQARQKKP